jgi:hypothetical protein
MWVELVVWASCLILKQFNDPYQEEGAWGGVDVMHIEQVTGHRPEETQLLPLT